MGGGRKGRVRFTSLILASSLALSCTFFSCANASGGGSGNPTPPAQTLSSARWSCTTSEEETNIGNKVSEVLCLFDENKFELRKNISYEDISFFQTFYKGTYEGSVIKGMTFNIEKELDTDDFDDEMKQVFNLESATAKSARNAMSEARAVYPMNIAAILAACQEKLKNVSFKNAEKNKTMSLETNGSSMKLTDTDGNEKVFEEKASNDIINLDGFLLTGNPCHILPEGKEEFRWANNEEEGAQTLKKTEDGKWTCQFRADADDTLIRIMWNDWMADWGLSAIDKEKSTLPRGAGITDDTQAVNKDHPEWQDSRNIAITGLEAKRKYDITFDTKKSPGKICIEIAEHKISTLDGWLLTGTPDDWSGDAGKGALPLKKTGSNSWTVTFPAIEGWNGFKLCTSGWEDYIGWSGFDWENAWVVAYNEIRGSNVEQYALEDDDTITFQKWDFDGTEKITLTFGINNGRVTCKTDIEYTKEFDLDLYTEYSICESEPVDSENGLSWNILTSGYIENDKSFSFSISESRGILSIEHILERNEYGTKYRWQTIDLQRLESVKPPIGVNWNISDSSGGILLTGLVPEKTYKVQLAKGDKTGYFKIIITE